MGVSPVVLELERQIRGLMEAQEKALQVKYNEGWGKGYLTAWAQLILGLGLAFLWPR